MRLSRFYGMAFVMGAVFLILLVVALGPLVLRGDEWIVPANVQNSLGFNNAIKALAEVAHRPLQSIHNALTYYLFDFHDLPYRLLSLVFHLLNIAAFIAVIRRAFPQGDRIALVAGLLVFFVPLQTRLFFNFAFDGVRLAMFYYWVAVYALQSWIMRNKPLSPVLWVEMGIFFLVISFLTYENALLLAPATLALVWSTARTKGIALSFRSTVWVWVRVILAVSTAYALWWLIRWFLGIDLHTGFASFSFSNFFTNMMRMSEGLWRWPSDVDLWGIIAGGLVFVCAGGLLWFLPSQTSDETKSPPAEPSYWRLLGVGVGMSLWVFGFAPYILSSPAGLGSGYQDSSLRIYGAAVFGLAVLIGLVTTLRLPKVLRYGLGAVCVLYVAVQAADLFTLRLQYQQLNQTYQSLYYDLASQVPNIDEQATLLIIHGFVSGPDFTSVILDLNTAHTLYHPTTFSGYLFDLSAGPTPDMRARSVATIDKKGVTISSVTAPLDHLVILRREGDHLVLVDTLTADDTQQLLVDWQDGITAIHTNPAMILHDRDLVAELRSKGLLAHP